MDTIFDLLAVGLFIATVGLFFLRFQHENPPLAPYMLISLICALTNWLGLNGAGFAAISLLSAASFYLLHLASEPYRDDAASDA